MTPNQILWLNISRAMIAAIVFAFIAGDVSMALASRLVQVGGPWFLREPLNVGLALLFLWLWKRWQPSASYSAPKWGHIGLGLAMGLVVGIILPTSALWLMVGLKAAAIKPPQIDYIALLVPFIFLIFHGFAEESILRTVAQRTGHHALGAIGGVAIAAVSFAILQGLQGYLGPFNIINSVLFGAVLGFLALGPGGIWSAVGAHAGWSWLETAALGQPGQIVKSRSLWAGTGPDSYGSPLFSAILIAVLALQLALHLRQQKRKA
jgi:membrane protease YdiL (CAAX protease family)